MIKKEEIFTSINERSNSNAMMGGYFVIVLIFLWITLRDWKITDPDPLSSKDRIQIQPEKTDPKSHLKQLFLFIHKIYILCIKI